MRKTIFLSLLPACMLLLASCSKTEVIADQYELTEVNIVASKWLSSDSLEWNESTVNNVQYMETYLYEQALTDSMKATGAILLYAKTNTAASEQALPFKIFDDSKKDHDLYTAVLLNQYIQLQHAKVVGNALFMPVQKNNISFRYILIQDAPTAGNRRAKGKAAGFEISELKKMKYKDVIKIFKLKDE